VDSSNTNVPVSTKPGQHHGLLSNIPDLVLAHIDIADKSNEIPAAQQLLGELNLAHSIVTLDAMHCQKKLEAAAQAAARLLVQLKENQPTRLQNSETICGSQQPVSTDTEVTVARNRHETRTVKVFRATQAVVATEWQSLIKLFVCVSRDALQRSAKDGLWSSTSEVHIM
jgi:predicted transposase YbfD/YdcC